MSLRSVTQVIRHHTPLWPLVGFVVAGLSLASLSLIRIGVRNPEVSINRKANPHPWERVKPHTVVKFWDVPGRSSTTGVYTDEMSKIPEYKS